MTIFYESCLKKYLISKGICQLLLIDSCHASQCPSHTGKGQPPGWRKQSDKVEYLSYLSTSINQMLFIQQEGVDLRFPTHNCFTCNINVCHSCEVAGQLFSLLWKYWLLLLFGRVMLLRKIKCGTILPYLICLIIKLNTVTTDLHLRLFHSQRCWLTSAAAQILTQEADQSSSKTLPPLHIFNFNADSLYAFTRRCVN